MGSEVRVAMDSAIIALDHLNLENNLDGDDMKIEELAALVEEQGKTLSAMSAAMDEMSKEVKDVKAKAEDVEEEEKAEEKDVEEKKSEKAMDAYELKAIVAEAVEPLSNRIQALETSAMDAAEKAEEEQAEPQPEYTVDNGQAQDAQDDKLKEMGL